MPSLIYLIGYRGTGKTTVARLLAEMLGWKWIDADQFLEARQGRNIRDIFALEGEQAFRDKESAILVELSGLKNHVIATGGGVIGREANRRVLAETGWVVWLRADASTLWQRLQQDPASSSQRPDLSRGGLAEIEELLRAREPHYSGAAHVTVDAASRTPLEVARIIHDHRMSAIK